jgi:hypothetical protein
MASVCSWDNLHPYACGDRCIHCTRMPAHEPETCIRMTVAKLNKPLD